jgi:hypothetical protein
MITIVTEQFIEKEGKWPQSWEDLITHTAAQQYSMYSWPDDCMRIREYVKIDFDADPTALALQNVDGFNAIEPIGPCYEYKHEGHIASLLEIVRRKCGALR